MKRSSAALFALVLLLATASVAPAGVFPLDGTKHDLSSGGTGSYKAALPATGGTTQVCVFCHTPHSAQSDAPLWNRAMSTATYQTYTSDVLAGMTYWAAEDPNVGVPHAKTRICLSCHDGTIALGSVVNMPASIPSTYTEIQMSGNATIQQTAPGFVGADLRDDHPVAIKQDRIKDPELVSIATLTGSVRLYKDNGSGVAVVDNSDGNYVECTSCHDPHDNTNGNFLVAPNTGSALCIACHNKSGFAPSSIHDTSTLGYSPTDGTSTGHLGSTVGDVKCMDCHFPHKSGVTYNAPTTPNAGSGRYLLSFQEESSCYNNPGDRWGTPGSASACHGSGSAGTKRDVQDETGGGGVSGKTSAHHVGSYTNFHNATEGRTYSWLGNWHVECQDCHNPHTAGNSLHTAGTNTISPSGVLYGAGGVNMGSWPAAWNPPTAINYNYIEPIGLINQTPTTPLTYEYEICFKCHSSFSWGAGAKPTTSTGTLLTDQAMEYNPSNASYHAVAGPSKLPAGRGTYVNGWTATSTITCSDCHGNDVASPAPQGPHGSINTPILKKAYTDNYSTVLSQTQPTTDLCFDCHDVSAYETGPAVPGSQVTGFYTTAGTNLHTRHYILSTSSATGLYAYRCVNCHAKIPHGYNRKALIVVQNEGAPYEAGGTGQGKITNALLATAGTYSTYKTTPDCTTVVGCHN